MNKLPPKTRTQILDDFQRFIRRHDARLDDWYVGTATSGRDEMFDVHGFKPSDVGLYRETAAADNAASIASFLIGRGAEGDSAEKPGGIYIYAFRKNAHTNPKAR
jgi:hypothetical protein